MVGAMIVAAPALAYETRSGYKSCSRNYQVVIVSNSLGPTTHYFNGGSHYVGPNGLYDVDVTETFRNSTSWKVIARDSRHRGILGNWVYVRGDIVQGQTYAACIRMRG